MQTEIKQCVCVVVFCDIRTDTMTHLWHVFFLSTPLRVSTGAVKRLRPVQSCTRRSVGPRTLGGSAAPPDRPRTKSRTRGAAPKSEMLTLKLTRGSQTARGRDAFLCCGSFVLPPFIRHRTVRVCVCVTAEKHLGEFTGGHGLLGPEKPRD